MLQWINIFHQFGEKVVANGLNLTVKAGEIVAILGASGSGKSTLLNIAAGLVQPNEGRVLFAGKDVSDLPPDKRRFALMFQDYALLPHLSVVDNVAFGLRMQGEDKKTARLAALAMIDQVGLSAQANHFPISLSGGEKQRVALVRALIIKPRALLLDEPFSALDSTLRQQAQQVTLQLLYQQNLPTVLVTHSPQEAFQLASRIYLLANGQWLQQGSPSEIISCPQSPQAAGLLGCDNIFSEYYIPPAAIKMGDSRGENSILVAVLPYQGIYKLHWQHPQYGKVISWYQNLAPPPVVGQIMPLWIDSQAIVYFSPNT